jgi:hypothetical protein
MKRIYGDKGQYLGYMTEDSKNVRAYDDKGKPVGNYNKTADQTYNANGSRSTFGNTVVNKLGK